MQPESQRIFYMDAMRGVLMTMGVLIHSAQVYNPEQNWLIYSDLSCAFTNGLIETLHLFRMPAFFMVSGFFCLFSILRYGEDRFLRIRNERILVPLVTTAITLNTIQAFLLQHSGWEVYTLHDYLLTGQWASHLWFLNYLIIYFATFWMLARLVRRIPPETLEKAGRVIDAVPCCLIILVVPCYFITILTLGKLLPGLRAELFGLFSASELLYQFQFFVFGAVIYWRKPALAGFSGMSPLTTLLAVLAATYARSFIPLEGTTVQKLANVYLYLLSIWFSCALCFYFFRKYANRRSRIFAFLSDASYTVYLFHHLIVIAIGLVLIRYGIGGLSGLVILTATVFAACALIHAALIARLSWLSYLFNGKTLPAGHRKRPAPAAPLLIPSSDDSL